MSPHQPCYCVASAGCSSSVYIHVLAMNEVISLMTLAWMPALLL